MESGLAGDEAVHDHRSALVARALRVIGQHHDARQTRDERDGGVDLVLRRAVLGLVVVGVQQQDGAREHVHDVGRRVAHDHGRGEAVGQLALSVQHGHEAIKQLARGQLAHEQQIRHFLVVEAALGAAVQQIVYVVAPVAQRALVRALLVIGDHVAVHVRDVRQARHHAGAVGVAQAALHVELLVERRVDGVDVPEILVERKLLLVVHGGASSWSLYYDRARAHAYKATFGKQHRESPTTGLPCRRESVTGRKRRKRAGTRRAGIRV